MKKIIFLVLCLFIVGCGNVENEELDAINNDIIIYLSNNQYDNLIFNYVDYDNKLVVVGLSDNSIEKQNDFYIPSGFAGYRTGYGGNNLEQCS